MTTTDPITEIRVHPRSWTNQAGADTVLRAALARGDFPSVPDAVSVAAGAKQRLDQLERAHRLSTTTADVIQTTVEDLLADRHVDPGAFDAELLDAFRRADVDEARMRISSTMHRKVESSWHAAVATALPELLDGLRVDLEELLASARAACDALGDLDTADAAAVASASSEQRKALLALGPLAMRYERIRVAQRAAIVVGDSRPPGGDTRGVSGPTWADVFARGVHEFTDVPFLGTVPEEPAGVPRLRQVAARTDVWLPDVAELRIAHGELSLGLAEIRARRAELNAA